MRPVRKDREGIRRSLTCAHCGQPVEDMTQAYLLRDMYALPEEPTYYLHTACMDKFTMMHPARWLRIPPSSVDAAWCL